MSVICMTPNELAKAMKNCEDSITVVGSLKNPVIRIIITGKVAWGVCAIAIAAAVTCYTATPEAAVVTAPAGGAGGAITFTGGLAATAAATATLGSAAGPALALGMAAGGVGILNTLRNRYKIVEKTNSYIRLQRK